MRSRTTNICDKKLEKKFIEKYRLLRRLNELIRLKLEKRITSTTSGFQTYTCFYTKNFIGESEEEILAKNYYAKTLKAINQSLEIIEKQAELTPLKIDQDFFERFVQDQTLNKEEKAATSLVGLSRSKLYAKSEPVYIHVVDKIEKPLTE